jgi:branched-chain amino acid transport system substrate-binding protein
MGRFFWLALGAWALMLCSGCDRGGNDAASAEGSGDLVIGHYASLTGSEANFGIFTDNGIKLAIRERNAAGGVKGRQLVLRTEDNRSNATEAATAVTKLISQDRAVAILGEVASSRSISGGQVAQRFGVPMVSPSSTNPDVTAIGDMIFRVCFIDPFQGEVCAKFAQQKGWKTAAILYDRGQAYSTGLQKNFREAFTRLGGQVVTEQAYSTGDSDFGAQINSILAAKPDVLFIPGYYTDVGNIAIQLRRTGSKLPLLGSDGWTGVQNIGPEVAQAMEGGFYSDHYSVEDPSERVQGFLTKYQQEFGIVPDSMAALGYDAANILFDAMERAPSLSGKDIAAALADTRDFEGVTGVITIDEQRNARKPAVMLEITGGKTRYVTTIEP